MRHPLWRVDFAQEFLPFLWARGVWVVVSPYFIFWFYLAGHAIHSDHFFITHSLCVCTHFPLTNVLTHSLGLCTHFPLTTLSWSSSTSVPGTLLGPKTVCSLPLWPKFHSWGGGGGGRHEKSREPGSRTFLSFPFVYVISNI